MRESTTHITKHRAHQGSRKNRRCPSRANSRRALTPHTEPRAWGLFLLHSPFSNPNRLLDIKSIYQSRCSSCAVGYLKLCSAEPGGATKFGILADFGECTPSTSTQGRKRDRTHQLAQLCPASCEHTAIRARAAPYTLPPCHGMINQEEKLSQLSLFSQCRPTERKAV